jgi:hypothetical protein
VLDRLIGVLHWKLLNPIPIVSNTSGMTGLL